MTASEPPAKWGANSRVEMTWCAEWKRAGPPQPAGGEEETKPGKENGSAKCQHEPSGSRAANNKTEKKAGRQAGRQADKSRDTSVFPLGQCNMCRAETQRTVGRCGHSKNANAGQWTRWAGTPGRTPQVMESRVR